MSYGELLDAARERAGLSKRALANLVAEHTGSSPDVERRAIYKYVKDGVEPDPKRAVVFAVILSEPALADVQPSTAKRLARRQSLEERVAQLEAALEALGPDLGALASLPERVLALERKGPSKTRSASRSA